MKMPIPTDWDGQSYCRFAVCWPDSPLWKIVLRGLLTEPTRGYFWDERTGRVTDVLADIRQTMDYNLALECVIMSCGDATQLIEALNGNFASLTAAIQALQLAVTVEPASPTITVEPASPTITVEPASPDINLTCAPDVNVTCGGGGSNTSGGMYGPYGQGPIIQPEPNPGQTVPGPGPGGYEPPASWPGTTQEFNLYKCQAANFLVDGYLDYIHKWQDNYSNLQLLNNLASIAEIVFGSGIWLLFLSPDAASLLLVYLTTIEVGFQISADILADYENYIQEHKNDWICDLYSAKDIPIARQVCLDYIGSFGEINLPGDFAQFHVDNMFKNYTLNILFEEYGPAVGHEGTEDCDSCGCELLFVEGGSGDLTVDGQTRTLEATHHNNGFWYISFAPICGCDQGGVLVNVISMTGYIPNSGGGEGTGDRGGLIKDCQDVTLWSYSESVAPIGEWCGKVFSLGAQAEQSFSAEVQISPGNGC